MPGGLDVMKPRAGSSWLGPGSARIVVLVLVLVFVLVLVLVCLFVTPRVGGVCVRDGPSGVGDRPSRSASQPKRWTTHRALQAALGASPIAIQTAAPMRAVRSPTPDGPGLGEVDARGVGCDEA